MFTFDLSSNKTKNKKILLFEKNNNINEQSKFRSLKKLLKTGQIIQFSKHTIISKRLRHACGYLIDFHTNYN